MASIDTGGKGPNVDLNLVPFIDLMSVLITFLLISAIWVQVSLIQIGSSLYAKKTSDQDIELLPDMQIRFGWMCGKKATELLLPTKAS
jgi:biopolymer transport protein ExbD